MGTKIKLVILGLGLILVFVTQFSLRKFILFDFKKQNSVSSILGISETIPKPTPSEWWVFDKSDKELPTPPVINAKSAIAVNLANNQIFYEKDKKKRLPIASLTKIMTAVIALENKELTDIFTVSEKAASMEPDSMGLFPGEKLTLNQLLQGLMLISGNDTSETIAEGISGNTEGFVKLMNEKARILGLKDTLFSNPSGLEDGLAHYSTVSDLAILSKYALKNQGFKKIVSEKEILIPYTVNEKENHKKFYLKNSSPLADYPGYIGIKPGFTPEAKKCLSTLVEQNNTEILIIVLGSDDRKGDTEGLLEYAKKLL